MSYYRDRRDEPSRRLYVGNIDRYVRERDLERLFGKLGRTVDVEILSDFGFVEYDDIRGSSFSFPPLVSFIAMLVCAR
ncbi:hypothetical protein BCR43DRAFT_498894 [Syncephalastrum racemosum]|uniref:RRM domain-containing protein n=1 Tax=Syncephalastrum racemosum TaxID=13706 RepID=A0A1X2H1K9_SYNRA|nr:hypothetical protein BCR43DRAFT_498894 [Syncephalastrum racemosum]